MDKKPFLNVTYLTADRIKHGRKPTFSFTQCFSNCRPRRIIVMNDNTQYEFGIAYNCLKNKSSTFFSYVLGSIGLEWGRPRFNSPFRLEGYLEPVIELHTGAIVQYYACLFSSNFHAFCGAYSPEQHIDCRIVIPVTSLCTDQLLTVLARIERGREATYTTWNSLEQWPAENSAFHYSIGIIT